MKRYGLADRVHEHRDPDARAPARRPPCADRAAARPTYAAAANPSVESSAEKRVPEPLVVDELEAAAGVHEERHRAHAEDRDEARPGQVPRPPPPRALGEAPRRRRARRARATPTIGSDHTRHGPAEPDQHLRQREHGGARERRDRHDDRHAAVDPRDDRLHRRDQHADRADQRVHGDGGPEREAAERRPRCRCGARRGSARPTATSAKVRHVPRMSIVRRHAKVCSRKSAASPPAMLPCDAPAEADRAPSSASSAGGHDERA